MDGAHFVHSSMNARVLSHLLATVTSAAVDVHGRVSEPLFSNLSGMHLQVELLDHMVTPYFSC